MLCIITVNASLAENGCITRRLGQAAQNHICHTAGNRGFRDIKSFNLDVISQDI